MNNTIRIAFFGTPDRALPVLDALKRVNLSPSLIVTQPDRPQGRKLLPTPPPVKIWAEKEKVPVLQPSDLKDPGFLQALKDGNFDVFVVVAYGKILKQEILNIPKRGALNLHASLLPRLRGSCPIETAILSDERNTGVTIILMDSLMDHGPILAREEIKLSTWPVSVAELSEKLIESGARLMAETIPTWVRGEIVAVEQDHAEATTTKKIQKEDGLIDFNEDPYKNYLKYLAYKEWPTTYFFVLKNGKKLRVIITEAVFEGGEFKIKKVIPEGKKEISFEEFQKNYGKLSE